MEVVGEYVERGDVADAHGRGVVGGDGRLVLSEGGHGDDGDSGSARADAVADRVSEVDLLGQRGRRGDAHERALQQLDDQPLRGELRRDRHRLNGEHTTAGADVVRQHGHGHRLVATEVGGVLDGDRRDRFIRGLVTHVDAHDADAVVRPGLQGVFDVVDADVG